MNPKGKGGMKSLPKSERLKVGQTQAKRAKAQKSGWPTSVQKKDVPSSYAKANAEWARLMAASKSTP